MYRSIFLFFLISTSLNIHAQDLSEHQTLQVFGDTAYNGFGNSLDLHGDMIIAGVSRKDYNNRVDTIDSAGSVYTYKRNYQGKWELEQEIFNPNPELYRYFGIEVAILKNTAVISSPLIIDTTRNCSRNSFIGDENVFLYIKDSTDSWSLKQRLKANDAAEGDGFGFALEMQGKHLFIGAPFEDQDSPGGSYTKDKGSIYLFEDSSGVWIQKEKIFPVNTTEYSDFGYSISVYGQYMWVGTYYSEVVFVFKKDSMGIWNEHQQLTPPVFVNRDIRFGSRVKVHGEHAIVSAPSDYVDSAWYAGAAYMYRLDSTGQWVYHQRLFSPHPHHYMNYGNAVALSDSFLVIGTEFENLSDSVGNTYSHSGAAYLYNLTSKGDWVLNKKLVQDTVESLSYFSSDICADNEHIVVGAVGGGEIATCRPDLTSNAGETHVYSRCRSLYSDIMITTCSEFNVPSGKRTLIESGVYFDTLSTTGGCDSIIKIDLTIYQPKQDSIYVEICSGRSFDYKGEKYNSPGVYRDTLTSTEGCDSIFTFHLSLLPPIENYIDTLVCEDDPFGGNRIDSLQTSDGCDSIVTYIVTRYKVDTSIEIRNDSLFANARDASYQWLDCNNNHAPLSGDTAKYLIVKTDGKYAVEVEKFGCIDTSKCIEYFKTNTKELFSEYSVYSYPNPTSGKVNFNKIPVSSSIRYILYNSVGEIIEEFDLSLNSEIEVDLPSTPGIYYIQLFIDGKSKTFKVMKY